MASIVKRKKKYSVVYSYTDENGKEHKKWETFESNAEAKHRKAEIEFAKANGTLKGQGAHQQLHQPDHRGQEACGPEPAHDGQVLQGPAQGEVRDG